MPQVKVAPAQKADLKIRYVASGHVLSKTIRVSAPETARVVGLPVKLHQDVKKGQLVAQLDDEVARQTLRSLEAQLDSARTKAAEDAALYGIRENQNEIQIRQSQRDQEEAALTLQERRLGATREARQKAQEEVRQAQEKLRLSERELARQKELYAQDIVSQSELDEADSQVRLDHSALLQAQADWEELRKGPRREELGRLEARQQHATLGTDLARAKEEEGLLLSHKAAASAAEVRRLEADCAKQRTLLARDRILSPVDGRVSQVYVEEGEMAAYASVLLALVSHGPYWVEADVDEQDAAHVRVGQTVHITLTSRPGKSYLGEISQVAGSLEARPQGPSDHKVLRVRVEFKEKVEELRSGLEADVEGEVQLASGALSVPRAALHRDQGKDYVLMVKSGRLTSVPVELGAVSGDRAEVRSGLSEGNPVVIEGGDGLPVGTAVQVGQ